MPDSSAGYYDEDGSWVDYNDFSWMYDYGVDDFATGSVYDDAGNLNVEASAVFGDAPTSLLGSLSTAFSNLGADALRSLKATFTNPQTGGVDWRAVAATAGGLYGLYKANRPQEKIGYQGKIPSYTAVREQVQNTYDPNRVPGSGGQYYFTNTQYATPETLEAAQTAAQGQATELAALNAANLARQARPTIVSDGTSGSGGDGAGAGNGADTRAASAVIEDLAVPTYARGGIASVLPKKKSSARYLAGATDGMDDKIPARIDGKQEARLSHGEFVIPADVVGHLGNGNSEAGAQRLYAMMDRIRKARTGTKKQGKQINPDKFLVA